MGVVVVVVVVVVLLDRNRFVKNMFFSNGMIFHLCNIKDQGGVYSDCGPKSAFQTPNAVVPMEFSESVGLVSLVWDLQGYTPEVSPEKSPSKKKESFPAIKFQVCTLQGTNISPKMAF